MNHEDISEVDPRVSDQLKRERTRQERHGLEMIASENYVSKAVLQAQGSLMTNKYAEGYPGKRYYAGCKHHDKVENLARERACSLFSCDHANVQPHSGSQANFAVYSAFLEPGDKILGPVLAHGGHLTHGHHINFSGELYDFDTYPINEHSGRFEEKDIIEAAKKHNPDLIVCGFSAYPREVPFEAFREAANEVDAYLMADIAHIAGLVAAGEHPSPFPECDVVTTTTHKTLRGARGGMILTHEEHADKVDKAVFPYTQGGPLMHQIAGKAVSFKEAQEPEFKEYSKQIIQNTEALGDQLKNNGFKLTSNGTDNHLVLVDLRNKEINGKEAETALEEAKIIVNKNMVPYDPKSPRVTSGIRIGTPALTTRGFGEEEMIEVANMISKVLENPEDEHVKNSVAERAEKMMEKNPVYDGVVLK